MWHSASWRRNRQPEYQNNTEANLLLCQFFEIWKLVHEHTHVCEIGLCRYHFIFIFLTFFRFFSLISFFFVFVVCTMMIVPFILFLPFSVFPHQIFFGYNMSLKCVLCGTVPLRYASKLLTVVDVDDMCLVSRYMKMISFSFG